MAAGIQGQSSCARRRGTWPTAGAHAGGGFGSGHCRLACGAVTATEPGGAATEHKSRASPISCRRLRLHAPRWRARRQQPHREQCADAPPPPTRGNHRPCVLCTALDGPEVRAPLTHLPLGARHRPSWGRRPGWEWGDDPARCAAASDLVEVEEPGGARWMWVFLRKVDGEEGGGRRTGV
jgi:hypothetical protein